MDDGIEFSDEEDWAGKAGDKQGWALTLGAIHGEIGGVQTSKIH